MARSNKTRLTRGQYEKSLGNESRNGARFVFLGAVARHATEVLKDLSGEPFDLYVKADSPYLELAPWDAPEGFETFDSFLVTTEPRYASLRESLCTWAKRYNLVETDATDRWCLRQALFTLRHWYLIPDSRTDPLTWVWFSAGTKPARIEPPDGFPEWLITCETRTEYLERIRMEADGIIAANPLLSTIRPADRLRSLEGMTAPSSNASKYCDELAAHYDSEGWHAVNEFSKKTEHFIWAVEVQILGCGYSQIAVAAGDEGEGGIYTSTVKRAVEEILDLVGLTRRSDIRPGRRRVT